MFNFDKIKSFFKGLGAFCKKHKKIVVAIGVLAMLGVLGVENSYIERHKPDEVKYDEFHKDLESGKIDTIYYDAGEEYMRYTLFNDETREMTKKEREDYEYPKSDWRMTLYPSGEDFREEMLANGVNLVVKNFEPKSAAIISFLLSVGLPIALIVVVLRLVMNTGVGKVEVYRQDSEHPFTFENVIGHDEIIKDLQFIVSLMRDKSKLDKFDMEIPKGMLFSGVPGTGKTLLAKAIAGESGVPFLYLNASNCIEIYAGTGAKRVRELFKEAKKLAPCIVFIDEIDAIGMIRDAEGSHSENVQTLNALLQEMDGFGTESGVFVIGATNNAKSLDKALLRAGRFDRQVIISPPKDWKVRYDLFLYYLLGVPFDVDVEAISKQCVGFTGADINMVVNEAKLIASMREADMITTADIEEAIDKRIFKGNRSNKDKQSKEKTLVAYHEAGHAVMTYLFGKPIARATIIGSTSGVGGFVLPTDDGKQFMTKTDMENQVMIYYAGRCSERIKFNEITNGASNDITQATDIIKQYVGRLGFNPKFGMLDLGVLGKEAVISSDKLLGLESEMAIKYEEKTEALLRDNYDMVEVLAQELLIRETLSGDAIEELLKGVSDNK